LTAGSGTGTGAGGVSAGGGGCWPAGGVGRAFRRTLVAVAFARFTFGGTAGTTGAAGASGSGAGARK
jgi:hypothetical protein